MKTGNDPAVIAKVIVAAATDPTPAALHRRLRGRPRQHAPPPCPRPDLRQADPQDQPDDIVLTGREWRRQVVHTSSGLAACTAGAEYLRLSCLFCPDRVWLLPVAHAA